MKRHLRVACLIFVIHQTVDMLLLFSCGVSACWPETPPEKLVDLTNPRVSSSSPGPSSSFIFILTLGDNLFLLLLWSHEAHFTGTCIKIWGKITFEKKQKREQTPTYADHFWYSGKPRRSPHPHHMAGLHSDGWRLRRPSVSVYATCFWSAGALPFQGGAPTELANRTSSPPPLLPLPPLPAPF